METVKAEEVTYFHPGLYLKEESLKWNDRHVYDTESEEYAQLGRELRGGWEGGMCALDLYRLYVKVRDRFFRWK